MLRTFTFVGIALMLIAFVLLFFLVQGTSNPSVANFLQSTYCEPEATIGEISSLTFGGVGNNRTTTFYCESADGTRREVTGEVILVLVGGFALPFVIGLLMTIFSASIMTRRRMRTQADAFVRGMNAHRIAQTPGQPSASEIRGQAFNQANIPQETRQVLEQVFGNLDNLPPNTVITTDSGQSQPTSLADRLRQLEEARDQGLINSAEYDRARQAILDSFDD